MQRSPCDICWWKSKLKPSKTEMTKFSRQIALNFPLWFWKNINTGWWNTQDPEIWLSAKMYIFFSSLRWNDRHSALLMINSKTITPCLKAWKGLEFLKGDFGSIPGLPTFRYTYLLQLFLFFNVWHIIGKLTIYFYNL